MSYYKDLSIYQYLGRKEENTFNIGWLEGNDCYEKGKVSEKFLELLFEYIKCPIYKTRGIYSNSLLDGNGTAFVACFNGYNILLGSSEIRVIDQYDEKIYASPDLILHYIINHNYIPPKCFIEAVLYGPKPNSEHYNKLIKLLYRFNTDKCNNLHCLLCKSRRLYFTSEELKNFRISKCIEVIKYNEHQQEKNLKDMYNYHAVCMNCGHLISFEYDEVMMGN